MSMSSKEKYLQPDRFPSARQRKQIKAGKLARKNWRPFILKLKSELAQRNAFFVGLCNLALDEKTLYLASRELAPQEREFMADAARDQGDRLQQLGFDDVHNSFLLEIKKAILSPASSLPEELEAAVAQAEPEVLAKFLENNPDFSDQIASISSKHKFAQAINRLSNETLDSALAGGKKNKSGQDDFVDAVKSGFKTKQAPPFADGLKKALQSMDPQKEKIVYEKLLSMGERETLSTLSDDGLLPAFLINRLPETLLEECLKDIPNETLLASLMVMDVEDRDFWLDLCAKPGSKRRLLFESELKDAAGAEGNAFAQNQKKTMSEFYSSIKHELGRLDKREECKDVFGQWLRKATGEKSAA